MKKLSLAVLIAGIITAAYAGSYRQAATRAAQQALPNIRNACRPNRTLAPMQSAQQVPSAQTLKATELVQKPAQQAGSSFMAEARRAAEIRQQLCRVQQQVKNSEPSYMDKLRKALYGLVGVAGGAGAHAALEKYKNRYYVSGNSQFQKSRQQSATYLTQKQKAERAQALRNAQISKLKTKHDSDFQKINERIDAQEANATQDLKNRYIQLSAYYSRIRTLNDIRQDLLKDNYFFQGQLDWIAQINNREEYEDEIRHFNKNIENAKNMLLERIDNI